jgi:hypothetical protein
VPSDGHCFVVEAGPQKIEFAIDSALEGAGFEPSVPRSRRFGEREPGKGHGDDKRLSRDSEYLKRDRTALLELPHPCGSALRG